VQASTPDVFDIDLRVVDRLVHREGGLPTSLS
jgi:hypothetical protein